MTDRIAEAARATRKLEWEGTDLYLGSLCLGFVDDTGTAWNAYAGCGLDPIGYGLGNAEARAAVEEAVREAMGLAAFPEEAE